MTRWGITGSPAFDDKNACSLKAQSIRGGHRFDTNWSPSARQDDYCNPAIVTQPARSPEPIQNNFKWFVHGMAVLFELTARWLKSYIFSVDSVSLWFIYFLITH